MKGNIKRSAYSREVVFKPSPLQALVDYAGPYYSADCLALLKASITNGDAGL
jgi:hypothetical protein